MSVFLFGGRANLVLLTLFYSTLLALRGRPLQTDRRTDGRTDRETNQPGGTRQGGQHNQDLPGGTRQGGQHNQD